MSTSSDLTARRPAKAGTHGTFARMLWVPAFPGRREQQIGF